MNHSPSEALFFDITTHPPLYQAEPLQFREVDRYRAICRADNQAFLGIKSIGIAQEPLVFTHQQARDFGFTLFERLFGKSGEVFRWYGTPPYSWASMLIGAEAPDSTQLHLFASDPRESWHTPRLSLADLVQERRLKRNPEVDESMRIASERYEMGGEDCLLKALEGMEPVIAVVNGFDADEDLKLYLLLTIPQRRYHTERWAGVNRERGQHTPSLTLDSFQISGSLKEELSEMPLGQRMARILARLEEKVIADFHKKLQNFVDVYDILLHMPLEKRDICPVILDVYDINRVPATVRRDDKLRSRIGNIISACSRHNEGGERVDYAEIVDFIMSQNAFDLINPSLERKQVQAIFEQKMVYKNCRDRLSKLANNPIAEADYLRGQRNAYEQLMQEIPSLRS